MLKVLLSTIPLLIVLAVMSYLRWIVPGNLSIEGFNITSSVAVSGHWMAEILGLSVDAPRPFSQFDCSQGEQLLERTVVIKKAMLRLCKPNILRMFLEMRTPIAEIGDSPYTGVDEEGVLFPLLPLYPDYRLPKIYIGAPIEWGQKIDSQWGRILRDYPEICELDISMIQETSLGKRELILKMRSGHWVRLLPESFLNSFGLYQKIESQLPKKINWVDLRISQEAFVF